MCSLVAEPISASTQEVLDQIDLEKVHFNYRNDQGLKQVVSSLAECCREDLVTLVTFILSDSLAISPCWASDELQQVQAQLASSISQADFDFLRHVCGQVAIRRGELLIPEQPMFSGEAIHIVSSVTRGDVSPSREIHFHFRKNFNPRYFADRHDAIHVGALKDSMQFRSEPVPDVLDMCIATPGMSMLVLPIELQAVEPVVSQMLNFWEGMYPDLFTEQYAYLTVDNRPVQPGTSQRVGGIHVDGLQGRRYHQKLPVEATFLVASAAPTKVYPEPVDLTNLDLSKHNVFEALEQRVNKAASFQCEENVIYLIDPYTPHESPVVDSYTERRFLRLEFGHKKYDRIGNTHNPCLEQYSRAYKSMLTVPRPVHLELQTPPAVDDARPLAHGLPLKVAREVNEVLAKLPAVDVWASAAPILNKIISKGGHIDAVRQTLCLDMGEDDPFRTPQLETKLGALVNSMELAAAFHNMVYLPAKQAVGQLYREMTQDSPARVQRALDCGFIAESEAVQSFIADPHGAIRKIYRRDILNVAAFCQVLGIEESLSDVIQALPMGEIVLHSLYRPWCELDAALQTELLPAQLKGITNLLTFCLLYEQTNHPLTQATVTDWMNASYAQDNPEDLFSVLPFSHPTSREAAKLDWSVFKNFVKLMQFDGLFYNFLSSEKEVDNEY